MLPLILVPLLFFVWYHSFLFVVSRLITVAGSWIIVATMESSPGLQASAVGAYSLMNELFVIVAEYSKTSCDFAPTRSAIYSG
jgi:hypothetical protein